jgi:hypothetical protein
MKLIVQKYHPSNQTGIKGLGLILTQRLAQIHGGDISFLSEEDKGSSFTILIPYQGDLTTSNFKGLLGDIPNNVTNLSNLGNLGNLGSLANLDSNLFGDDSGGDLISGTVVAGGFKGTVDRKTVDAAFTRILGSKKIGSPTYGAEGTATTPSPAEEDYLDFEQAEAYLNDLDESAVTTT